MCFQRLKMENKNYWAEFLGTFLLVFFGTGSIIISEEYNGVIQAFGIGVVFGVTVWILVHFLGKFSDCHINPAVTVTFYFNKNIEIKKTLFYIFFQLFGAVLASLLLHYIFPFNQKLGNTIPSGSVWESFFLEFGISFILMGVIVITNVMSLKKWAPLLIGFTVFLEAWLAGPICGASMNPARSFGPSIISGTINFLWLYFLAPTSGMLFFLLIYRFFNSKR
ncbi:aquaporin [Flavobacterium sp. TP390]|uniref:Aquaporin n=2 Tax=Flavobacterium profundi TaxID=1774945 RepID=A0A6I4IE96_9FLAO|nr:aquaporin [Flavobacterium profundi]